MILNIELLQYICIWLGLKHEIYNGSDIAQLLGEIQKAQNVINKIKDMKQGMLGTALVSVMNEVYTLKRLKLLITIDWL